MDELKVFGMGSGLVITLILLWIGATIYLYGIDDSKELGISIFGLIITFLLSGVFGVWIFLLPTIFFVTMIIRGR